MMLTNLHHMIYLDANNGYGHSMMQLVPSEIFDWVNPKNFNLDNYSNDSLTDCFLEDDLDYPDELQDVHNDYSLAREKLKVTEEMFSKCLFKIIEKNNYSLLKTKSLFLI